MKKYLSMQIEIIFFDIEIFCSGERNDTASEDGWSPFY